MGLQMVPPGGLIYSFSKLHEKQQILSSEIELFRRTREVKTPFRGKLAFSIFPSMPPAFRGTWGDFQQERRLLRDAVPHQCVTGFKVGASHE